MGQPMASRSSRRRRVRKKSPSKGLWGLVLALAAIFGIAWLASRRPKEPSMDDRVMDMIRENPSAEVFSPGPAKGSPKKETPEAFRPDGEYGPRRGDRPSR